LIEGDKPLVDERRRIGPNDVRITQRAGGHWLVSKYPIDQVDAAWPGSTFSSRDGGCPEGPDLEAISTGSERNRDPLHALALRSVTRAARDVLDPAGSERDEAQDVDPLEERGLDAQKVTGAHARRLLA
jgi:hypothetical protein